jgi:opacity protein-like surface antigen
MASLRLYPFPYMYVAAGGVYQHLNLNFSPALNAAGINDTTKNRWGFQTGGGLEIPLTSWVALQADTRYVWIDYDLGNVPGASNLTTDYYIVRFGLGFGFDWDWWTNK